MLTTDINAVIVNDYTLARVGIAPGVPITLIHIGSQQTLLALGAEQAPETIIGLEVGSMRTGNEFFRHNPPRAIELERAIAAVEDELARARTINFKGSTLRAHVADMREIARAVGMLDGSGQTIGVERIEHAFEQLAAVALGRPATQGGIRTDAAFAATLLILRELMHHLGFASATLFGA